MNPPCACPQEELPAILKHKKSLQKLVSDWNTLKSRYDPSQGIVGLCRTRWVYVAMLVLENTCDKGTYM